MIDADRLPFYQSWAAAWEQCGKSVTDRMLRFAFECLKQFDLPIIQRAILLHAQDPDCGQFGPKPADIVKQIEGGGDERSLKAWTKVEQAVIQAGPHRSIAFDDNRIHAVIEEMGGYMRFCTAKESEFPFMRGEFCKRYRAYLQQPPSRYPAVLYGETKSNQPVMLIGNPLIAERVMLYGGDSRCIVEVKELAINAASQLEHMP